MSVTLLSLITVMMLSAISWRLLEKPLIKHAHRTYGYATEAHCENVDRRVRENHSIDARALGESHG
jgi:peptidoglycan/LPS O-acetylase OafA/YrhL